MDLFFRQELRKVIFLAAVLFPGYALAQGDIDKEFEVSGRLSKGTNETKQIEVCIAIPEKHYIYSDSVHVEMENSELTELSVPKPVEKHDPHMGKTLGIYTQDVEFVYAVSGSASPPLNLKVKYQGCSDTICFMPASESLTLGQTRTDKHEETAKEVKSEPDQADWKVIVENFAVGGRTTGYMPPDEFTGFLLSALKQEPAGRLDLRRVVEQKGWLIASALILLGGLALNLTPCVLPMIPINLAIIGAGSQAASRGRGWALGGLFGAGMAVAYGVLGALVVLTGARFGTLNSSPWFNAVIAALFVVLALGMFGVFNIDLSRFQPKTRVGEEKKGSLPVAFVIGAVMALLAGACVAPVVISALLFATELYAEGKSYALILPFLLGVGMALPWPFAGAGFSFLPKPGKWMNYVKYSFGIIILGFALYYGILSAKLFMNRSAEAKQQVQQIQNSSMERGWHKSLTDALTLAEKKEQPVLIDFWASWCKSCIRMEKTTFKDPEVVKTMEPFVKVKFQAEDMDAERIEDVLDYFDVLGLPTYVVLVPQGSQGK